MLCDVLCNCENFEQCYLVWFCFCSISVIYITLVWLVLCEQVSAVTDEPTWPAESWQMCCKQRWTLSVINLRLK